MSIRNNIVWETLGQSSATFVNSTYQTEYQAFKERIDNEINQISARPSFNGKTITITAGESKTITDTILSYLHIIQLIKLKME